LAPDQLEPDEAQFLANVRQAQRRAETAGTSVEDELIDFAWRQPDAGSADGGPDAVGQLTIGPELGNRVGHLQGGALYAPAARAAHHGLGEDGWRLAAGTYQFLRPGEGELLIARATILRRGRAVAFARTQLDVDRTTIGSGQYVFRPAAASPVPA